MYFGSDLDVDVCVPGLGVDGPNWTGNLKNTGSETYPVPKLEGKITSRNVGSANTIGLLGLLLSNNI